MQRMWRWCWRAMLAGLFLLGLLVAHPPAPAFAAPTGGTHASPAMVSGEPPTAQETALARQRARQARLLMLGSLLLDAALLGGFLLLGGTRWLARRLGVFGGRWVWAILAVGAGLALAHTLITLPLAYYAGYLFPHRYGLSNQTVAQWLRDAVVSGLVGLAISLPALVLVYGIMRRAPRAWWAWVGVASVPLTILLLLITPLCITPLFNRLTPLRDEALRRDILAMAHAHGVNPDNVYEIDASRQSRVVNAYVYGIGPTQRIVLYDTLLTHFTPDEIKSVMAHEIGHYVMGHLWLGIAASVAGVFLGAWCIHAAATALIARYGARLGIDDLAHPAGYPLLLALLLATSLALGPIGSALSRHVERQADAFAYAAFPHPAPFISAFHKLARISVAEETPPRWVTLLLSSHPSITERIAAIERWAGDRGNGSPPAQ